MLTAVANGRPVMMNGWKPIWPPGCYWVENTHSWTNAFGWVLITGGWHVNNWCFTGSAIQYTPNAYSIINTHWGWGWCGFVGNPYTDWVSQWWGWQASGTFSFSLDPTCRIADRHDIGTQVWGNGHENWWP